VPPPHFDSWNNTGLVRALRAQRADLHQGLDPLKVREQLRRRMQQMPQVTASFLRTATRRICEGPCRRFGTPLVEPAPEILDDSQRVALTINFAEFLLTN